MSNPIPSPNQHQQPLFHAFATALRQCIDLAMQLRNLETSSVRDLSPPEAATTFAFLGQILTEIGGEMITVTQTPPLAELAPPIDKETTDSIPPRPAPESSPLERFLHFHDERRLPNGTISTSLRLSLSEWELSIALVEANGHGLTNMDLAEKVTRWRGTIPSPEAAQRMISRLTEKLDAAGVPFRGKTENVNLSAASVDGRNSSKKRGRGRPPKGGDGQFRAFLHEVSL